MTLYGLIHDLAIIFLVLVIAVTYLIVYAKYELQALKVDGYMHLRLEEKVLNVDRSKHETNRKYDLKIAKLKNKK